MQKTVKNIEEMMIYMKLGRDNCIARGLNNRRILQNAVRKCGIGDFATQRSIDRCTFKAKGGVKKMWNYMNKVSTWGCDVYTTELY